MLGSKLGLFHLRRHVVNIDINDSHKEQINLWWQTQLWKRVAPEFIFDAPLSFSYPDSPKSSSENALQKLDQSKIDAVDARLVKGLNLS